MGKRTYIKRYEFSHIVDGKYKNREKININ